MWPLTWSAARCPAVSSGKGHLEVWSKATGEWNGSPQRSEPAADTSQLKLHAPPIDIQNGDLAQVWYIDANNNWVGAMLYTPYLFVRANQSHDWVQGEATPQTTVFVTVMRDGTEIGNGQSSPAAASGGTSTRSGPTAAMWTCCTGDVVRGDGRRAVGQRRC